MLGRFILDEYTDWILFLEISKMKRVFFINKSFQIGELELNTLQNLRERSRRQFSENPRLHKIRREHVFHVGRAG